MVDFYVALISDKVINEKTGAPWTIDDVPALWRNKVREALENKANE